jgi:uncharacterized protein Veg
VIKEAKKRKGKKRKEKGKERKEKERKGILIESFPIFFLWLQGFGKKVRLSSWAPKSQA